MLPINFHKTFIPERRLIAAFLEYAAIGGEGTLQEMSEETGIPTGKSTGKMPAIIDYCCGMGLVVVKPGSKKQHKKPVLTKFGEAVVINDKYLGEPLTQWLAHINLCRSDIGTKVWHKVFAQGRDVLGVSFSSEQIEDYLVSYFGSGKKRTGPLLSVYSDDAALGRAKVITVAGENVIRHKAPILASWAVAYSAIILDLMESFFPDQTQVTLTDFTQKTYCFDVCLWEDTDIKTAFSLIENKGFIALDRQIRPWLIEKQVKSRAVWPRIFDDIA